MTLVGDTIPLPPMHNFKTFLSGSRQLTNISQLKGMKYCLKISNTRTLYIKSSVVQEYEYGLSLRTTKTYKKYFRRLSARRQQEYTSATNSKRSFSLYLKMESILTQRLYFLTDKLMSQS
mmetsp:Transcript_5604/g.22010  ORF Transcript_5604/g.22010 Transcript_5604/m.22010 type:complete len:120 (-) Transcript_5604:2779-3138(-)